MSLAVFQSIGPTELLIVLVIVLVIFGPKRLPGLGRSLGSRHARVQGLGDLQGLGPRSGRGRRRQPTVQANAALGRAEDTPPVDGEVVSDRETRAASPTRRPHRMATALRPDQARRPPQPRRAPRRAADADHHLPGRLSVALRPLLLAERRDPRDPRPAAREVGVHGGQRGPAGADRGLPAGAEALICSRRCWRGRWRGRTTLSPELRARWAEWRAPPRRRAAAAPEAGPPAGHARRRRAVHGHVHAWSATPRCCCRCRCCSTSCTRSSCRRSRRGSARSRCR